MNFKRTMELLPLILMVVVALLLFTYAVVISR
jgi:hypothetical protein